MKLGAHESASGGPYRAVERAIDDGCESLQLFTKNNNRWEQRMWNDEEVEQFRTTYAESDLEGLMAHSSYLINPCSQNEETIAKSREAIADELTRCQKLGIPALVVHPGNHTGRGIEEGLDLIVENVRRVYDEAEAGAWSEVTLLFENTAGQGTSIGYRFEHLATLLERLDDPDRFGVCFDTCHAHAAGYDLTDRESYESVWEEFDDVVGLEWLEGLHLNGSRHELGSRKDRHDQIDAGEIGLSTFAWLVNDPRFEGLPAVVETPPLEDGEPSFERNVAMLKDLRET